MPPKACVHPNGRAVASIIGRAASKSHRDVRLDRRFHLFAARCQFAHAISSQPPSIVNLPENGNQQDSEGLDKPINGQELAPGPQDAGTEAAALRTSAFTRQSCETDADRQLAASQDNSQETSSGDGDSVGPSAQQFKLTKHIASMGVRRVVLSEEYTAKRLRQVEKYRAQKIYLKDSSRKSATGGSPTRSGTRTRSEQSNWRSPTFSIKQAVHNPVHKSVNGSSVAPPHEISEAKQSQSIKQSSPIAKSPLPNASSRLSLNTQGKALTPKNHEQRTGSGTIPAEPPQNMYRTDPRWKAQKKPSLNLRVPSDSVTIVENEPARSNGDKSDSSEKQILDIKAELASLRASLGKIEGLIRTSLAEKEERIGVPNISQDMDQSELTLHSISSYTKTGDENHQNAKSYDVEKVESRLLEASINEALKTISTVAEKSALLDETQKHQASTITSQINAATRDPETDAGNLLNELFPDESSTANRHDVTTAPRPRLHPSNPKTTEDDKFKSYRREDKNSDQKIRKALLDEHFSKMDSTTTLVQFNSAPLNLKSSDFARLLPRGKHIPDWETTESFFRVVASRDDAFQRNGQYFLIFPSPSAARSYQANVVRLHRLIQAETPTGRGGKIFPPPGYSIDGIDAHAAIHSYTVLMPTQNLSIRLKLPPLRESLETLMRIGGNPQLAPDPETKVIFWVEGSPQPSSSEIFNFLNADGRRRGLLWNLKEIKKLQTEHNVELITGTKDEVLQKGEQKWVLTFEEERMAVRFWRRWHRTPWPSLTMAEHDVLPTVNIEMV